MGFPDGYRTTDMVILVAFESDRATIRQSVEQVMELRATAPFTVEVERPTEIPATPYGPLQKRHGGKVRRW